MNNNIHNSNSIKSFFACIILSCLLLAVSSCNNPKDTDKELPNIIIILADDMGYGDVACLNDRITATTIDTVAAMDGKKFWHHLKKLEFCAGSGGWSYPRENKAIELGLPPVQLYNLKTDIVEENNIAAENPEIVESLTRLMQKYIDEGRSTPGISQQNTGQTKLFKTKSK